jgi:hypothetical protein
MAFWGGEYLLANGAVQGKGRGEEKGEKGEKGN